MNVKLLAIGHAPAIQPEVRLDLLSVVALVLIFGFGGEPAQEELLCQVGALSLAGVDKEIPEHQPQAAIRRRIVGIRDVSRGQVAT